MTTPLEAVGTSLYRLTERPCGMPLPDGVYVGRWSGFAVRVYIGGVRFELRTMSGQLGSHTDDGDVFQPQAEVECFVVVVDGVMKVKVGSVSELRAEWEKVRCGH